MAQRATGYAKTAAATKPARLRDSARASPKAPATQHAIPLALTPLLSPHRKHGRLCLRVEKLPQLARLSAGRNNGDSSWSLAIDELEDLAYLPPEGMEEAHTLAIRIISLEGGSTLEVVDFPVQGSAAPGARHQKTAAQDVPAGAQAGAELRLLRDELASATAALAAQEAELAEARQKTSEAESFREKLEAELAQARAAGRAELDERLAAAAAQAISTLGQNRQAWQQESDAGLAQAKAAWKAAEAAHLAAAEAQWQETSAKALAAARAEAETAQRHGETTELQRLRKELAAMQAALADRETRLSQAASAAEEARRLWQQQSTTALGEAKAAWKAEEAARLAAETAQRQAKESELRRLREELAAMQAMLVDRETRLSQADSAAEQARERRQQEQQESATALAQAKAAWKAEETARAEAETAKRQAKEIELRRLREELAAMQAALADRETSLSRAGLAAAEARQRWQQDLDAALAEAKATWKTEEAARLEPLVAQPQGSNAELSLRKEVAKLQAALADRETRLSRAESAAGEARERLRQELETALAQAKTAWKSEEAARAQTESAQRQSKDSELERLRQELAAMQAALAERDSKTTQLALAAGQGRGHSQQELAAALEKAKAAWKSEEAARLAAAEAQWQEKSAKALAAARAEGGTAQRQGKDTELRRLREELAATKAALADREMRLSRADSSAEPLRQPRTPSTIVLKTNRIGYVEEALKPTAEKPASRHYGRDIAVAAALAASAIVFYPRIAAFVPGMGTMFSNAPAPVAADAPAPAPAAKQNMAVVNHAANVRAGPSSTAEIVSTLQRGLKVASLEQRGNWTLVEFAADNGKSESRQGWVYSSFVEAAPK
jgi:hypothetical protein